MFTALHLTMECVFFSTKATKQQSLLLNLWSWRLAPRRLIFCREPCDNWSQASWLQSWLPDVCILVKMYSYVSFYCQTMVKMVIHVLLMSLWNMCGVLGFLPSRIIGLSRQRVYYLVHGRAYVLICVHICYVCWLHVYTLICLTMQPISTSLMVSWPIVWWFSNHTHCKRALAGGICAKTLISYWLSFCGTTNLISKKHMLNHTPR